jgi:hypothetical protein
VSALALAPWVRRAPNGDGGASGLFQVMLARQQTYCMWVQLCAF